MSPTRRGCLRCGVAVSGFILWAPAGCRGPDRSADVARSCVRRARRRRRTAADGRCSCRGNVFSDGAAATEEAAAVASAEGRSFLRDLAACIRRHAHRVDFLETQTITNMGARNHLSRWEYMANMALNVSELFCLLKIRRRRSLSWQVLRSKSAAVMITITRVVTRNAIWIAAVEVRG